MDEQTPTPQLPPPTVVLQRLHEAFGGADAMQSHMFQRIAEFNEIWNRDSTNLGRVLHAHLVVEYFLTQFLQLRIPQLPPLSQMRLRYDQKVRMIPVSEKLVTEMKPGLSALGSIRNDLAHVRRIEISKDSIQAMLNVPMYAAIAQAGKVDTTDSLAVVLNFAQTAAGLLHAIVDPHSDKWAYALGMGERIDL